MELIRIHYVSGKTGERIMKRYVLLFLMLAGLANAQTVISDSLFSKVLKRSIKMTIVLPRDYDSTKTHSVFYLLHYLGGDDRAYIDMNMLSSLDNKPIITVTPDVGTSWYINSKVNPAERYEDFFRAELFSYIDNRFNTDTASQAIGGSSMGGYGALLIGLKNSERFNLIADLSGAINVPFAGVSDSVYLPKIIHTVHDVFGKDSEAGDSLDIFSLIRKFEIKRKPYIFMAIGSHDEFSFLIDKHRELAKLLEEKGYDYEYKEIYGGHFTGEIRWCVFPYLFNKIAEQGRNRVTK